MAGADGLFAGQEDHEVNNNDEFLDAMLGQIELETNLKQVYEDTCKQYKNMIVSRRIVEAALMGTHAQVLQLRSRVMKNDSRTTLLANELRSILHNMPETIEKTLARIHQARAAQRSQELDSIKTKYQEQ